MRRPALGDTLQAVRGHAYADPLAAPGEADLTAHVDFAALAARRRSRRRRRSWADRAGRFPACRSACWSAPARLGANADEATRARASRSASSGLPAPDQMGTLFKVLAITRPGVAPPPFALIRAAI